MVPALLLVPGALFPFTPSNGVRKRRSLPMAAGCIPRSSEALDALGAECYPPRGPDTPGQSWPPWLHSPACAHTLTLPFHAKTCHTKHCEPLSMVPSTLLPRSSAQCVLPALWLLASALPALNLLCFR